MKWEKQWICVVICVLFAMNVGGKAEAHDICYTQINEVIKARSELFDLITPLELSTYQAHVFEYNIEQTAKFLGIQTEKSNMEKQEFGNKYYQDESNTNLVLVEGHLSFSRDGEMSGNVLKRFSLLGTNDPIIQTDKLDCWENDLAFMSREEVKKSLQDKMDSIYHFDEFDWQIEVYAVLDDSAYTSATPPPGNSGGTTKTNSSSSTPLVESLCYLVDIDFHLENVPVAHKSFHLFSGRDMMGMHLNAVIDAKGIRYMQTVDVMYSIDGKNERQPALDCQSALKIFAANRDGLLLSQPVCIEQAVLQYIPMPMYGWGNEENVVLRPIWCIRHVRSNQPDWIEWTYIDALTGEEYDMY